MYEILASEVLTPNSKLFRVEVPHVAGKAQPGQFVVVRIDETGERIPLTVADQDPEERSITIIVQEAGKTSQALAAMHPGQSLATVAGPLGVPSHIERFGTITCLGGGFGMAAMFPIARALKETGNFVIGIIGARNVELLLWEDRLRSISDEFYVTTDDGSKGRKGFVTEVLKDMLDSGRKIDLAIGIGPVPMMRALARTTQPYGLKTMVSLNPTMVDGTGLCGACRVSVGRQTKFCCVDGPDFDAHQVDWDELI